MTPERLEWENTIDNDPVTNNKIRISYYLRKCRYLENAHRLSRFG